MVSNRSGDPMLWKRMLTILVAVPLVFFVIIGGTYLLILFLLILAILALLEFYSLFNEPLLSYLIPGSLLTLSIILRPVLSNHEASLWFTMVMLLIFIYYLFFYRGGNFLLHLGLMLAGSFYIGWFIQYPVLLLQEGTIFLFMALLLTWANDSFAYLIGSTFGKHKLAPDISPNKSIEGALGGILGTLLVGLLIGHFAFIPLWGRILLSILSAVAAQLGDLFESKIKRVFGVKDSGTLFPGHGGVMDRIDSLLFSLPVVYYLLPLIL